MSINIPSNVPLSVCQPGNSTCNFNVGSVNPFTGVVEYAFYNYNPHLWVCATVVAFYGLFIILHTLLILWSRQYWLSYTLLLGAVAECLGWSGRLWSRLSVVWGPALGGQWDSLQTPFLIQISTLIFAPAFYAACNYLLLGTLIPILGVQYSFLHPTSTYVIFVTIDVVSLTIQAIGGGIASSADTLAGANQGGYIMAGGVFFQMAGMLGYSFVLASFAIRYYLNRPVSKQYELFTWWPNSLRSKSNTSKREIRNVPGSRKGSEGTLVGLSSSEVGRDKTPMSMDTEGKIGERFEVSEERIPALIRGAKILLGVSIATTVLIFIRSIYRCVELLQGWTGPIISNEWYFNFLDGMLMIFVPALFLIVHPGYYLPRRTAWWHATV